MKNTGFKNYFEEYLEVCHSISPKKDMTALSKSLRQETILNEFSFPSGICLVNYSDRSYNYMCGHCYEVNSHSKDKYMNGGLDFHLGIWFPDDKAVFDARVFRDILEFWKLIPSAEIDKYRFSFNHRYLRQDGSVSQLLQHGTYLEPEAGNPILNLVVFTDIGDFKTDNNMTLTISRLESGVGYVKVFSKSYVPQRKPMLSVRESEILRLSLNGLSSKMIADKLFISIQTVKNHKANMMEKTSAKNIAELINLSLKNNWI